MAPSQKTMLFVCLLVAALLAVVAPGAQAQTLPVVGGNTGGLLPLLTIINGTLYCTVNGSATIGTGGVIISPPFKNATVQLRCGAGNGTVVASVLTGPDGQFSIVLKLMTNIISILSECRLVVATPLASCNATLPTGYLVSNLTQVVGSVPGLLNNILNLVPAGFRIAVDVLIKI